MLTLRTEVYLFIVNFLLGFYIFYSRSGGIGRRRGFKIPRPLGVRVRVSPSAPFRISLDIEDYNFELPEALIAKEPKSERSSSRLLIAEDRLIDKKFSDLIDNLRNGDLLVINDTKVFKARLEAQKVSGGKVELLIERKIDANNALALTKSNRPLRESERLQVTDTNIFADIIKKDGYLSLIQFSEDIDDVLDRFGTVPLPPYIDRKPDDNDEARYQTVYADANNMNSVAAPTAGLHFDNELLERIKDKGVNIASITLNIGIGTFKPIKQNDVKKHIMHSEKIYLSESNANVINEALLSNSRIFCVGTTSLRCLESIYSKFDEIKSYEGETDIFIYPGFKFKVADYLITNFHLPKTTLLLLVSAFSGLDRIKAAYKHAIEKEYRFFSYGDAMLLKRQD